MAQSPERSSDLAAGSEYLKSWDALGALIAQGHSFSGRERNCAFLNLGATHNDPLGTSNAQIPTFACAAGALSLDQMDDSRSVIPVDWDGDGDLDLWYGNRTAPRLRFLRNDAPPGAHWLALKLEGASGNRDAVGARVELALAAADGTTRTLWRRLRAGDGFLSQTPKTVHFGFRNDETIQRVVVRWPPRGNEQVLTRLVPGRSYLVLEDEIPRELPRAGGQKTSTVQLKLPKESGESRIVLVNRLAVPTLEYFDFSGQKLTVGGSELLQPTLLLLWASWCEPCLREMRDLVASAGELKAKNLRILALSVETATPSASKDDIAAAERAIAAMKWPFEAGVTHEGTLRSLALLESKALYPERPLPLPTSYLLDPSGRMVGLYHGPASPLQILRDAALAEHPPESEDAAQAAAFPFPGRSAKQLFAITPVSFARALREAGYLDDARNELRRHIDKTAGMAGKNPALAAAMADAWWRLADIEEEAGRFDEAVAAYQQAIAFLPSHSSLRLACAATLWRGERLDEAQEAVVQARALAKDVPAFQTQLGKVWQALGEHARARESFAAALAASPDNIEARFNLAVAKQLAGDAAGAAADYEALSGEAPDLLVAASNLAWVLGTTKDEKVRQPARALALAEKLNTTTRGQSPAVLDNLAAALAASGDYARAVQTAQTALRLALATGEDALAEDVRKHLAAYREKRPWIE
ncbi:MAG: ASPIC/UnbV domain-containing protein [Verrucomicrobiales bacterium]